MRKPGEIPRAYSGSGGGFMPSMLSVSYQAARAGYHDNAGAGTLPCLIRNTDLWSVLLPNVDDTKFWVMQKVIRSIRRHAVPLL